MTAKHLITRLIWMQINFRLMIKLDKIEHY